MPRRSPQQMEAHSQAQRERILAAAIEIFAQEGYDALSMRKIARQIGQSPTTIYLYFRDKDELLSCICETFFAHLVQALSAEMAAGPDVSPQQVFERGLRCYLRVALAYPVHYQAALLTPRPPPQTEDTVQGDMSQMAQQILIQALTLVMPSDTPPEWLAAQANACWAALHGLVTVLIQAPGCFGADPQQTQEAMIRLLVRGLT